MIDREIKRALRISIVTGVILSVVVQPLLNYLSLLLVTTSELVSQGWADRLYRTSRASRCLCPSGRTPTTPSTAR